MTEGIPTISFPEPIEIPKIDRSAIAQLLVETEQCPLVLHQILSIVAERELTPFTISSRRDSRIQLVDLEIIAPAEKAALGLLQDIRRLRNVRVARLLGVPERFAPGANTEKL